MANSPPQSRKRRSRPHGLASPWGTLACLFPPVHIAHASPRSVVDVRRRLSCHFRRRADAESRTVSSSTAMTAWLKSTRASTTEATRSSRASSPQGRSCAEVTPQFAAGVSITQTYEDWKFGGDNAAFGGQAPCVEHLPPDNRDKSTYAVTPDMIVNFTPSIRWRVRQRREHGDALVDGTLASQQGGRGRIAPRHRCRRVPRGQQDEGLSAGDSSTGRSTITGRTRDPFPADRPAAPRRARQTSTGRCGVSGRRRVPPVVFPAGEERTVPRRHRARPRALLGFSAATYSFSAKSRDRPLRRRAARRQADREDGEGNDVASDRFNGASIVGESRSAAQIERLRFRHCRYAMMETASPSA